MYGAVGKVRIAILSKGKQFMHSDGSEHSGDILENFFSSVLLLNTKITETCFKKYKTWNSYRMKIK